MSFTESVMDLALGEALTVLKDKKRERKILIELKENIKSFDKKFENTEIDTNTFNKFLSENTLISVYFSKIFLSGNDGDSATLDRIVEEAVNTINFKKNSQGISEFSNKELVEEYFKDLSEHLLNERKRILGLENLLLVAEVKDELLIEVSRILKDQLVETSKKFVFESQFLKDYNNTSIISLGQRYSPEINVETQGYKVFETIFQTPIFQNKCWQYYKLFHNSLNTLKESLKIKFESDLIQSFDVNHIQKKASEVTEFIESIADQTKKFTELQKKYYYDLREDIYKFEVFLSEYQVKLWETPFLIVTGEAAIGKSHLLADTVQRMENQGYPIVFTLGQQFFSTSDPLIQIVESLGLNISVEEFLSELDKFSKEKDKRAFIIIDALNETEQNIFWKNQLQILVSKVSKYRNIGLIFSVRTTYLRRIIPDNFISKNQFQVYNHNGITDAEDKELEIIENYFSLDRGEILKIYPEFSSPLFLKLAAISSKSKYDLKGRLTWENLISHYLIHIENEISRENRLDYDGVYLETVIEIISSKMLEKKSNYLNYNEIKKIISKELEYDMDSNKQFLDELIKENFFSKFKSFDGKEKIHFTYEKIRDFFIARNIMDELDQNEENFKTVIKNTLLPNSEYGVIEILFFMIPNKFDKEITDYFDEIEDFRNLGSVLIGSIPWRNKPFQSDSIISIFKNVLSDDNLATLFFEKQFLLSIDSESPFNSEWLTTYLYSLPNDIRDYVWTTRVSNQYYKFPLLFVNRIERNYNILTYKQLQLALKQLVWLLSSVDSMVRDKATKVISLIMINKPELTIDIINEFNGVSDMYIKERMYASVFGAIVKFDELTFVESIANRVYEVVFNSEEIEPNIMLRNYARQTVEYALHMGQNKGIDKHKIIPPYQSEWYDFKLTNKEVDEYKIKYKKIGEIEASSVSRIISSMTTEYGRGVGAYGDFGRYTLGARLSPWKNQFDDQELSNIAFKRIFELGFNPKLHAKFDRYGATSDLRTNNKIERIGKKYQWIAYYELLAKLADNFEIYDEKDIYDQEYKDFISSQSLEKLLSLYRNQKKDVSEGNDDLEVKKMNREEHIIETIKTNKRFFQGPFEDYMKDIDPTFLTNLPKSNKKLMAYSRRPSLIKPNVFEDVSKFVECTYEGKKFINLYFNYKNKEDTDGQKESSDAVGVAIFFKGESIEELKEWHKENFGEGVSPPYNVSILLFELYWSSAYKYFEQVYSDENEERIFDYAVYQYLWESNDDYSLETGISINNPSKELVDYFSLNSSNEGVWEDSSGNIIAFDGAVFGYEESLWFDEDKLNEFLDSTGKKLFWKSWGAEKQGKIMLQKWFLIEKQIEKYETFITKEHSGEILI